MPVEALTAEYSYLGDGITTNFPFPSRFLANEDLHVALNGVEQFSGFTISGAGEPAGGEAIFSSPPTAGVRVMLLRDPVASQLIDFENGQTVLEGTLDNALDKLTMIAQFLTRAIKRSVRITDLSYTTEGSDLIELPAAVLRVSKLFGFDANGKVDLIDRGPYEDSIQQAINAAAVAVAAANTAVAARDDVRTKWLGAYDFFPESVDVGFAIVDGAGVYVFGQPNPLNDGIYVRVLGLWERVGASDMTGLVTFENIFTTAGQTVVVVPGGYIPGQIEVYRNGAYQKIGPSPGPGGTEPDCDASDGTNINFPAATLLLDDWVLVRRTKHFNIAGVAAMDVVVSAIAGLTGTNVQAALADLQVKKAPLASPAFTGTPSTPNLTGGSAAGQVANKKYVDDTLAGAVGMTLIASGSNPGASLDFALGTTYRRFILKLRRFEPVTNGSFLQAVIAVDGVPTYLTTSNYGFSATITETGSATVSAWQGTATEFQFTSGMLAVAGNAANFDIEIENSGPSAYGSLMYRARTRTSAGSVYRTTQGGGEFNGSADRWTHIRFSFNAGNIGASAAWALYGLGE